MGENDDPRGDFARIVGALPLGVVILGVATNDAPPRIVSANPKACALLGRDEGGLDGVLLSDVHPPGASPAWRQRFAELARAAQPEDLGDVRWGIQERRFRVRAVPLGAARLALVFDDNTERHDEARAVASQRAFLEAVVENIPNMIFVKDAAELRFVRFNRAGERLLGLGRDALIGKGDTDFFPPEQAAFFIDKDRQVLAGREVLDIPEEPIQTPTGTRWLHTQKVPVFDHEGAPLYLLGISEDITERREVSHRLEALVVRLEQQREELARSNRDLEQFAYVASHDLQEPLRKIRAFGERLETRAGAALDDEARDYLRRMTSASERMGELIDALVSLSRVGTAPVQPTTLDFRTLVAEVLLDLEARVMQERGEVRVEGQGTFLGDKVQMRQVLTNLVANALKFHRPGQGPRVCVRFSNGPDEATSRIDVEDDGVGFDARFAERIFHPFVRLHGRTEYQGTGMGLAITRRIAERHGGAVVARSEPGKGATFTLTLPTNPGGTT